MTPAEIAASLSEAQRRALGLLSVEWSTVNKRSHVDLPMGLLRWRPSDSVNGIDLRLSPLGLSVRRALLENSHD